MKQDLVGVEVVVEEPPHRVGNTRGRGVGNPHLKCTQVIVCRAKVYGWHSVICPGPSVGR
jgi:hypothetical protein